MISFDKLYIYVKNFEIRNKNLEIMCISFKLLEKEIEWEKNLNLKKTKKGRKTEKISKYHNKIVINANVSNYSA